MLKIIPNIKKSIRKFLLEESGSSNKKGLLIMGLTSVALSATAHAATDWDPDWTPNDQRCVGLTMIDNVPHITRSIHLTNNDGLDYNTDGTFSPDEDNGAIVFTFKDLMDVGLIDMPGEFVTPLNLDLSEEQQIFCDISNHISDDQGAGGDYANGDCRLSGVFSDSNYLKLEGEDGPDMPSIFWHGNSLEVAESDSGSLSIYANHLHDIHEMAAEDFRCHLNARFREDLDCSGHASDHLSNGDVTDWVCEDE